MTFVVQAVVYIDRLVQERCDSIANALELRISCTKPSVYRWHWSGVCVFQLVLHICSKIHLGFYRTEDEFGLILLILNMII